MHYIKNVTPGEKYFLEVMIDNGSTITLNFEDKLNTIRFGMLRNQDFFKKVTTDGNFLYWGNQLEISISELLELAQK